MEHVWYILEDNLPIIAKFYLWLNNVLLHYIWSAWRWSSEKLPALSFKFNMMASQKCLWLILAHVGANQKSLWDTLANMMGSQKFVQVLLAHVGSNWKFVWAFWPTWGQIRCLLFWHRTNQKGGWVGGWGIFIIVKSDLWHSAFTTCVVNIGLRTFWSFCCFGIIQILGVIQV